MKPILSLIFLLINCTVLHAQEPAPTPATPPSAPSAPDTENAIPTPTNEPTEEEKPAPLPDDGVRVSILGYHEFSATKSATEMRIPTGKFRQQMQAIKDLGLNVISLDEFQAWKRGEKSIPDRSILITIDDGWKSVYTDAYPILKEFGYPFTIYLYTNYVDGGGRALTSAMITEMQKHGCTIGSHSVSHPLPSVYRKKKRLGEEAYRSFLEKEFGGSKKILERKFKQPVTTYVYPGGYYTEEMFSHAEKHGYEHLFTVKPGKVRRKTPNTHIPRYVILGTHDSIFEYATAFSGNNHNATAGAILQTTPHPVTPKAGETITSRLPLISADLSKVDNLDPASIVMRVSGFGKVPATYHAADQSVSWQVNRRLRSLTSEVTVQWRLLDSEKYESPMRWTFRIDREAAYLPRTAPSLPAAPSTTETLETAP